MYSEIAELTRVFQKLNFTAESHIEENDDWGSILKSVLGKIFYARYDMYIGDWLWARERYEVATFELIYKSYELLMRTPTNMNIDFGRFVRPISLGSWVAIS
jgi:hypothetical protein